MASKNSVNIKIAADTKEASKNIKDIKSQLDRMGKSSNSFSSRLSKLSTIASGVQSGFSMLSGAIQKVSSAVNECMELYDKQAQAETQLSAAAKNNPYWSPSHFSFLSK